MSHSLDQRLDQILPKIVSEDFLSGRGLGNEIPFHIFDYPPEHELRVRDHLTFLESKIAQKAPELDFRHVNLLDLMLEYIRSRGQSYYDKWLQQEERKGTAAAIKAIGAIASAEKVANYFEDTVMSDKPKLVLMSGIGSCYPIIRTHELLSNLHRAMALTPLVVFYPGVYDKISLKLFGKSSLAVDTTASGRSRNARYYRAFRLID